jgi:hypothetical protein
MSKNETYQVAKDAPPVVGTSYKCSFLQKLFFTNS